MAAEMDGAASQELVQFWKDVPKTKIVEHRYHLTIIATIFLKMIINHYFQPLTVSSGCSLAN